MIDRHVTLIVWAVLGAVVVCLQTMAVLRKGGFPGLGAMVTRAGTGRVGRCLFALAWMWLGWHAFAR